MPYERDDRLFHCKECGGKQNFDVNNENDRAAMEFWDDFHAGCKQREYEKSIVKAMRIGNKSMKQFLERVAAYEERQSEEI